MSKLKTASKLKEKTATSQEDGSVSSRRKFMDMLYFMNHSDKDRLVIIPETAAAVVGSLAVAAADLIGQTAMKRQPPLLFRCETALSRPTGNATTHPQSLVAIFPTILPWAT